MNEIVSRRAVQCPLLFEMNGLELWRFDYNNISDMERSLCVQYLDNYEKERYHRYRIEKYQNQFAISRMLMKSILSNRLNCLLSEILFDSTAEGKPYLKRFPSDIFFNYSDSETTGLFAVYSCPIGIDIEKIKYVTDIFDTMDMIMNLNERGWVLEKDSYLRYYCIWTMKEAYLKYLGKGLSSHYMPDLSPLLNKPLRTLHLIENHLENTTDLYIYTDKIDDNVFSLVCSKG